MFLNHIFIICGSLGKYNPNHKIIWVSWSRNHIFISLQSFETDESKIRTGFHKKIETVRKTLYRQAAAENRNEADGGIHKDECWHKGSSNE